MENDLQKPLTHYFDFINLTPNMYSYWKVPEGLKISLDINDQIEMLYNIICIDASKEIWELYGFKERKEIIGKKYKELIKERTLELACSEFISNGYQLKNYHTYQKTLSGETIHSLVNWHGVVENETLIHVWAISKDITNFINIQIENEKLIEQLKNALNEIKTLRGILPICAHCKKIRDDQGLWTQIEAYIRDHSEAEFTHGICPKCLKKHYSG